MTSYRWQRALWITALAAGLLMTELVPAQAQQFPPPAPSLSVAAKEFQHDQVLLQQQRLRNQLAELQLEYARLQAEKRQYQAPTRRKVEVSPAPTWRSQVAMVGVELTVLADAKQWRWRRLNSAQQ